MALIPRVDAVYALLRQQTESLAQLPDVVASLAGAVRGIGDTVQEARQTLAAVQRLTARMDSIVEELEQPLRALRPGLEKLAVVLDDPVVEDLPATLRAVRADVLPVLRTLADTSEKVAYLAGSTDKIMAMGGFPAAAAGLLGRRRPPPSVVVLEQEE